MPTVSVVIPVYNIERHLRQCLDSVLCQTCASLEILCVDDGSTDGSGAILQEYTARDGRIRVLRQENGGPGAARNRGMEQSHGEYILFLDADDWFEPDMIASMLNRAEKTGADVTICRAVCFDSDSGAELPSDWMLKEKMLPGEVFSPSDAAEVLFQFTYGWAWDKLYRASFLRRTGLRFPELRNSEDLVFTFLGLALAGRIAFTENVLVHHRMNRVESVSNSREDNFSAPFEAAEMLRGELRSRKVFERFERSFLNWELDFLVWHAANLEDRDVQKACYDRLKNEWLPAAGYESHLPSYYHHSVYLKYMLVRRCSFSWFRLALRLYKAYGRHHAVMNQRCER